MQIKPIETQYKEYRFRSRLEARWAVFFDALGIKWEYETEGFDLGEAGWYLPDFWLPAYRLWIEIKPSVMEKKAFMRAANKACTLAEGKGQAILFVAGAPSKTTSLSLVMGAAPGESALVVGQLCCSLDSLALATWAEEWTDGSDFGRAVILRFSDGARLPAEKLFPGDIACLEKAIRAARSARFEHGETPNARRAK